MSKTSEKLGYTRETQKLMYWFFPCFAEFWGESPEYAKETLKKLFINEYDFGYSEENALQSIISVLRNKDKLNIDELIERVLNGIQALFIKQKTFSTALYMLTQKQANDFISFMFKLALQYNVELRRELIDLWIETNEARYTFIALKYRRCAVCGKVHDLENGVSIDLHHVNSVASIGGYEKCDGTKTPFLSLCREHHNEFHNIGKIGFRNKYKLKGIWLNKKVVESLLDVYPNQFKAARNKEE